MTTSRPSTVSSSAWTMLELPEVLLNTRPEYTLCSCKKWFEFAQVKSDFLLCTSFFILQYCFTLFCFIAHYSHVRGHEIHKLIFTHNNLFQIIFQIVNFFFFCWQIYTLLLFSIVNEVILYRTLPWVPGLGGFSYLHTTTCRLTTSHAIWWRSPHA